MVRLATNRSAKAAERPPVELINGAGTSPVLLVCEHASNFIPEEYDGLGLGAEAQASHVAWDPGALAVALDMSRMLDARLVAGTISRLVYDCNRPPESPGAMPARSELVDVPGNTGLSAGQKAHRVTQVYEPFRHFLEGQISASARPPVLVTVHSFTPVYMNKRRDVEIGILHDEDSRLADAMLAAAGGHRDHRVERNQPYGPADGVTHTLKLHALKNGLLNVMLEIANNLLTTEPDQKAMAGLLTGWLTKALGQLGVSMTLKDEECRA